MKNDKEIKIGDIVQMPNEIQYITEGYSLFPGWDNEMNQYLGKKTKIVLIKKERGIKYAKVEIDNTQWYWPLSWLWKFE